MDKHADWRGLNGTHHELFHRTLFLERNNSRSLIIGYGPSYLTLDVRNVFVDRSISFLLLRA